MSDFHSMGTEIFTASDGMIALVKQAFEANGVTLNID